MDIYIIKARNESGKIFSRGCVWFLKERNFGLKGFFFYMIERGGYLFFGRFELDGTFRRISIDLYSR